MKDYPYQEDKDQLRELLKQYENLRTGRSHAFLEEDSFEKIIGYFDEKEEYDRGLEAADLGIEQFPYSASILLRKADILLALQRYHDALEVLNHASIFDPSDINLYILKTDAHLALDQQDKAVQLLEQALDMFEGQDRIELLFELTDVYDDYEEFDKVFDCLKMILEQDPNNEEGLYKICFWTDFTGRNEESIRLHQKVIDEYPYNELAWFNLAAAYQGLKLYEKAIDAYQYAIVIEEKFDYAYRNMGDAFIRMRKYKEAIEALEKVTELSKPEDVIYEAMGHCYDKMKNFAQARFYYRKASHLNQGDSKLIYRIATTYFNEGQYNTCIKQLDHAIRIGDKHAEYYLLLGESKLMMKQYNDALQAFFNVVRLRPKKISGWEAIIRCFYKAGQYNEALSRIENILRITNEKPIFYYYEAALLFAIGKSKEATIRLEKALSDSPKLLKRFIELNPALLQHQTIVDIIAKAKKNTKGR